MNRKLIAYLGAISSIGMGAALGAFDNVPILQDENSEKGTYVPPDRYTFPDPKPHKGQKEYCFTTTDGYFADVKLGGWVNIKTGELYKLRNDEIIFSCFAINHHTAIKKFNNRKS